MIRLKMKFGMPIISLLLMAGISESANAMPMFGKQTGLDCKACHMQHIPKLNATGRKFAASGMTQSRKDADAASSGMDVNPSIMVKSIYEKTWDQPNANGVVEDTRKSDGEWSIPRTATLYVGGKMSEDVGAIINLSYKELEKNSVGGKVVYANEIENGYWGAAIYSAYNFGPFSGMETYNTGLYKPLRGFDIKTLSNAVQATKIGSGSATGAQLYVDKDKLITSGDHIFATVGTYAPTQDNTDSNLIPFAKLAYEQRLGDFNFILGGFGLVGGSTVSDTEPLHLERETYGIDLQIEGTIANKEISLVLNQVLRNKVNYTGIGAELTEDTKSGLNQAFSAEGEVNLTPDFGLKLAYMNFDDLYIYRRDNGTINTDHLDVKDINYAITAGFDYSFEYYLPMKLAVEHSWAKPTLDRVKSYRDLIVTLNILF